MFKGDGAHTTDVVSEPFYHGLSVEGSRFYPLFSRESLVLVRLGEIVKSIMKFVDEGW